MKIGKYNKMREYRNYKWKKEKLFYFAKPMEISLEKHETYPDMYYINFPEGRSRDFYNITRAKDLAQKVASLDQIRDAENDVLKGSTCV